MPYTRVGPFINDGGPRLNATNLDLIEQGVIDLHRAPVRSIAGGTTLVLADASGIVEISAAGTVTVPPNSSVPFPVGTVVAVSSSASSGTVSVAAGAGVTVNSRGGLLNLAGQWGEAYLRKRATDTWVLVGDLA